MLRGRWGTCAVLTVVRCTRLRVIAAVSRLLWRAGKNMFPSIVLSWRLVCLRCRKLEVIDGGYLIRITRLTSFTLTFNLRSSAVIIVGSPFDPKLLLTFVCLDPSIELRRVCVMTAVGPRVIFVAVTIRVGILLEVRLLVVSLPRWSDTCL